MNAKKYTQPANFKPGLIKRRPEEQMFRRFTGPLTFLLMTTFNAQTKAPPASHALHGTYEELSAGCRRT